MSPTFWHNMNGLFDHTITLTKKNVKTPIIIEEFQLLNNPKIQYEIQQMLQTFVHFSLSVLK